MVNPPQHTMCRCDIQDYDPDQWEIVGYRTFTDIWNGQFVRKRIPVRQHVDQ